MSGTYFGTCAAGRSSGASMLASAVVLSFTSHLPRLEIDARIDPGIGEVGDQVHDQADEREDVEIGEHDRVVAVEHAFEAQQPEAVEREDGLDEQRTGEEC